MHDSTIWIIGPNMDVKAGADIAQQVSQLSDAENAIWFFVLWLIETVSRHFTIKNKT